MEYKKLTNKIMNSLSAYQQDHPDIWDECSRNNNESNIGELCSTLQFTYAKCTEDTEYEDLEEPIESNEIEIENV